MEDKTGTIGALGQPAQGSIVFDRAADYYDGTRGFPPDSEGPVAALMTQAGGWDRDSQLIEIGIGTGRIALPLAPSVRQIYGADLSRKMMERLLAKRSGGAVYPVEANAVQLPYPTGAFDGAVVVHVLHLIPNWRDALNEIARVLRPDGRLVVGGNGGRNGLDDLWKIWQQSVPVPARVGLRDENRENEMVALGWRHAGAKLTYTYTITRTPQGFIDQFAARTMSSCWLMTDEQIEAGLAALREAVQKRYSDPSAPIEVTMSFDVQAFLPPVNAAG